ncbi:MAG: hypothetical protein ACR2M1_02740 [Gemmatimonadaceae bacterium]
MAIEHGACVKIPDGRIARVRDGADGAYRVRVKRKTSKSHTFLELHERDLTAVDCPKGWMSPAGYRRYLKTTLEKMRVRNKKT